MKVPEAKIFIRALVEHQVPITPCLVGAMGIGKSQIVAQVAEDLEIGLIDLRLAQMETGDLIGIPFLGGISAALLELIMEISNAVMQTVDSKLIKAVASAVNKVSSNLLAKLGMRTLWAAAGWWPEKETKGILLLDEINRAPNDVRQAVFQLILADSNGNRKLHTHILPKGWAVVAAMNPDNGEYQVETLDRAMVRRFIMLAVQPDVESWLLWAKENNKAGKPKVDSAITAFIAANKNLLNLTENFDIDAKPSSDAWTMLSQLREAKVIPYEAEFEIMAGLVGKEAATAFRKWLDANYTRPVNGEEVLNKYEEIAEKLLKQRNDEWYATKLDLLTHLAINKDLNKKQTENLKRFIKDSPADIQAAFVQGLPPELIHKLTKDDEVLSIVAKSLRKAGEGK
jgi:MoxR-like ATPase